MILCVDSGNTRLKWGLRDGDSWLALGACLHAEHGDFAAAVAALPAPERVVVANVAGAAVAQAIEQTLAAWRERLVFVRSGARAGGVVNGYEQPGRLGVDRWCALVGARGYSRAACLVVGAGTATTVDTLDAAGTFRGGLILPGFDLMRRALAGQTAGLPLAAGEHRAWPRCTDDAIYSGCLEAQAGAIERAYARLAGEGEAECLLFGGAAPLLDAHLAIPRRRIDTLVLDGLHALAIPDRLPGGPSAGHAG